MAGKFAEAQSALRTAAISYRRAADSQEAKAKHLLAGAAENMAHAAEFDAAADLLALASGGLDVEAGINAALSRGTWMRK